MNESILYLNERDSEDMNVIFILIGFYVLKLVDCKYNILTIINKML